jgi:hypothetical protein
MSAGLPDGCMSWDVPNNGLRAENRAAMLRAAERQARDEIAAECGRRRRGTVRNWYTEWVAEFGHVSPGAFARMLERQQAALWRDRVNAIFADMVADERDSA